jgi:hypothetical protein
VRALIAATPALSGQREVSVPYVTRAYWCICQELRSTTESAAEAAASVIV